MTKARPFPITGIPGSDSVSLRHTKGPSPGTALPGHVGEQEEPSLHLPTTPRVMLVENCKKYINIPRGAQWKEWTRQVCLKELQPGSQLRWDKL